MSLEKTQSYLRMLKLAGREEIIPDDYPISEDCEEITETEWADLPRNMKCLKEGKKYVLKFDNEFKLKPIKTDNVEDKSEPQLNKTSDYESDGGDTKKANKDMIDNDKMNSSKMPEKMNEDEDSHDKFSEGVRAPSVTPDDEYMSVSDRTAKKSKKYLDNGDSKLKLQSELDSADDADERRMKDRLAQKERKRKSQEKADKLLKKSKLKLEGEEDVKEQFENPQEFDDKDAEEYYGLDGARETEIKVPADIIKSVNQKVKDIEASIGAYDDKGYNDGDGANSNKNKAIDALEQIKDNLSSKDFEGFRQAQLFFQTLMSPITDLFPADLVSFLTHGPEGEGSEFGKDVEAFETSLKESYMFKRQDSFNRYFINEVLPEVVAQYGYDDKPAIRQVYNDTLDSHQKDGLIPDSSSNWTLPDEVEENPSKFLKESIKTLVEYGTNQFGEDNTAVETWFERDRKYVGLYPVNDEGGPDTNQKAIVEWWDESVDEAIEDGFLDPRDWHRSALDYAKKNGIIKESKSFYSLKNVLNKHTSKVFEASGVGDYKVYHKGKLIGHTLSTDPVRAAITVLYGKFYHDKGRDAASEMRPKNVDKLKTADDLEKFNIKVVKDEDRKK
jgi:hypothetical protein